MSPSHTHLPTPALVMLSLDNLDKFDRQLAPITQHSLQHKERETQTVSLPAAYGRKPLTEEEIEVINVSMSCSQFGLGMRPG